MNLPYIHIFAAWMIFPKESIRLLDISFLYVEYSEVRAGADLESLYGKGDAFESKNIQVMQITLH